MVEPIRKPIFDVEQGIIPCPEKIDFFLLSGKGKPRYWVNERPPFYVDKGERGSDSEWEDIPDLSGPTVRVISLRKRRGARSKKVEEGDEHIEIPPRNRRTELQSYVDDWGCDKWKNYFEANKLHPCQGGIMRWSEVVRKRRPEIRYAQVKRVLPAGEKSLSKTIEFIDLPQEVFSNILGYLNGFDLEKLGKLNRSLERKFYDSMVDVDEKKLRFWEDTVMTGMQRDLFLKFLCSYYTVLHFTKRNRCEDSLVDFAATTGVEEFARAALHFWDIIENADLVLDDMTTFEITTKESLRSEVQGNIKLADVVRISGTAGTFIFNYWFPKKQEKKAEEPTGFVSIVDAIFCKNGLLPMYRWVSLCKDDCRFLGVMYLPFGLDLKYLNFTLHSLPKFNIRVLVSACKGCYHIQPIDEGEGKYLEIPYADPKYDSMNPLIAIHKNFIGGWENPRSFRVHKVWAEKVLGVGGAPPILVIRSQVVQNLHFSNAKHHWERISKYREFYVPKLHQVKLNVDHLHPAKRASLSRFFSRKQIEDYFELHLVSSTFGKEIMGPFNDYYTTKYVEGIERPFHCIERLIPKYYIDNATSFRDKVSVVKGGKRNFGMNVFWSREGLAVSWDERGDLNWLFLDWESALKSIKDSVNVKNMEIRHVEICWSDGIVVALKNDIIILKLVRRSGGTYRKLNVRMYRTFKSEPKLIVYPVRVINVSSDTQRLAIDTFSCDFAAGIPYILVELKDETSDDVFNYYIKRFSFGFRPGDGFPEKRKFERNQEWDDVKFDENLSADSSTCSTSAGPLLPQDFDVFEFQSYEDALEQMILERNSTEQSSRL